MQKNSIIYLYGLDGSGKSTVADKLKKKLEEKGLKVGVQWMRFHHYFSRIVNGMGHLFGLARYETYPDGTKIGYHDYHRSRILSFLYCLTTVFDTFLSVLFFIWIPGIFSKKILILDRFIYDKIVDLSIDTGEKGLSERWTGKILRKLIPKQVVPFFLSADNEIIFIRRPDVKWDRHFQQKKHLYEKLSGEYGHSVKVKNNDSLEKTVNQILLHLN